MDQMVTSMMILNAICFCLSFIALLGLVTLDQQGKNEQGKAKDLHSGPFDGNLNLLLAN